jgi:HTH-type transcriptional regulator / antitoxin HigA
METLKYKVITSEKQYDKYCRTLEDLVFKGPKSKAKKEEIALLTLLIEKWDEDHDDLDKLDPIALLKALMKEHKMKSWQLAQLLHVSESLVSGMLHYEKALSKNTIRILASHFKIRQEVFNRPYHLRDRGIHSTAA